MRRTRESDFCSLRLLGSRNEVERNEDGECSRGTDVVSVVRFPSDDSPILQNFLLIGPYPTFYLTLPINHSLVRSLSISDWNHLAQRLPLEKINPAQGRELVCHEACRHVSYNLCTVMSGVHPRDSAET